MRSISWGLRLSLTSGLIGGLVLAPSVSADDSGGLDRATMLRLARSAGPVHVRGRTHLSGRIFAREFRVEEGAEVTIEGGTEIWSAGDIRIDAPIRGADPAPSPRFGGPGKTRVAAAIGARGADTGDLTMVCEGGDFTLAAPILVGGGGDGGDVDTAGPSGQGGDGGKGAGVTLECSGTLTILANIQPGRGGRGGAANVAGTDGAPGINGERVNAACGGAGGTSGDVKITASKIVFGTREGGFPVGEIMLRPGGLGGEANAVGGRGGDAAVCFLKGGHGGDAIARGGKAGRSTKATIVCNEFEPPAFDGLDIAGYPEGERADGGTAHATGGDGGNSECVVEVVGCPARGRTGGKGGFGGSASALGGAAASGGLIDATASPLKSSVQPRAETPPGFGGGAVALGGRGGNGGLGETASRPGRGGTGGNGGDATARGAAGASALLGTLDVLLVDSPETSKGGDGGLARATGGDGGDAGDGGDCCERLGGAGGAGGLVGRFGKGKGQGGAGGYGFRSGARGTVEIHQGTTGLIGVTGAACEPDPGAVPADVVVAPNPVVQDAPATFTARVYNYTDKPKTDVPVQIYIGSVKLGEELVTIPAKTALGRGEAAVEFQKTFSALTLQNTASVRINGVILARALFDVVRPPCSVVFTTNEIDFGTVPAGSETWLFFGCTNPSATQTVKVAFPPISPDGNVFFDPHAPSGSISPELGPGETLNVEVCFVVTGDVVFDTNYTICGQPFRVRGISKR